MNCKEVINFISKDELNATERTLLNAHFEKCLSCKGKFLLLDKTFSLLKNEIVLPQNDFTDKVMSKIDLREPVPTRHILSSHRYLWRLVPTTAIATIAVVVGLFFLQKREPSEIVVTFKIAMPDAQTVTLAGDFNSWDIESLKLKRQNGIWVLDLPLPPGKYQYVFIIDGRKWLPDPYAEYYVDSGFGAKNSVVDTTRL